MPRQRYDSLDLLTYSKQLDFKTWASHHGLTKKAGADYYFDFVTPVDATKPSQPDIKGFRADGTVTFGTALRILKKYFKIA